MLPSQGSEILGKAAAVWSIVYSAIFGGASLAQAMGIIIPVAFLAHKWKNESLRRKVLEKILVEEDSVKRGQMVTMVRESSSQPGEL